LPTLEHVLEELLVVDALSGTRGAESSKQV
jgi:hypothetical protein